MSIFFFKFWNYVVYGQESHNILRKQIRFLRGHQQQANDHKTFENILINNKPTITFINKPGVEKMTKMVISKYLNTTLT